ncbi:MAG: DUF6504 family protein [Nocardioides sp.]
MRRYDDPVEVRKGLIQGSEGPEQFLWRGRLWKVRAVLAHWVETGPWWGFETGAGAPSLDPLNERELWRVEAGRGALDPVPGISGVFDLSYDWSAGSWQLVGCQD